MSYEPLDTSHADTADLDLDGDARDVVTGPIGSARLVEPSTVESLHPDRDELPRIEIDQPAD